MKERFQRFMAGRYGPDNLGRFLTGAAMALLVVGMLVSQLLVSVGLAAVLFAYYRMFSRKTAQRAAENAAFLRAKARVLHWFHTRRERFSQRGAYRYYRCPSCRQDLRVPKGQGTMTITCPKCRTKFEKKS